MSTNGYLINKTNIATSWGELPSVKSFAEVLSFSVSGTFTAVQVATPYKLAAFIFIFF